MTPLITTQMTEVDRIAEHLRDAMARHRLTPGTVLREKELAMLYGCSRTVIQQVLIHLEELALVTRAAHRSAQVRTTTEEELDDVFTIWSTLDREALALLSGTLTPVNRQVLKDLLDTERRAHYQGHDMIRTQCSREFHEMLARRCPNRPLGDALMRVLVHVSALVVLFRTHGPASCYMEEDHQLLLEALIVDDADRVYQLGRDHIEGIRAQLSSRQPAPIDDVPAALRPLISRL
ncbi:GntR family transcriptional regulator [Larsenimonas rhizosphaerae]|uniref:GntR family transcriptional regulator n=1 Tax=Larsenimonas rhizosphaerae TaxID=2944682 RepID=A0AA42CTV7_9GAMM|nr:GntR family transcriptional regulator [Larsenimonas rhizosphaerae]MCX2523461.1 GntR family transcriptional regulator [Larsenimonas rhizosphaerae]